MATRQFLLVLSHNKPTRSTPSQGTSMNSKRHLPSSNNGGQQRQSRRPPKWRQQQHRPASGNSDNKRSRPTHFLALPIGHHPELRNAMSALTSSWLAHEPPIDGLDPSIVVHPRRLHLTLGVMALTSSPNPNSRDLASATALLTSLAPRIRTLLAQNHVRVSLGRLAIMQPDPERAHVLYAEPDLRSPDGRRLRAVCGVYFFLSTTDTIFSSLPSFFLSPGEGHAE
jgi:A-kinase anchor protein AKAP7